MRYAALLALSLAAVTARAQVAHPGRWPVAHSPTRPPAIEARVDALLARMSLEDKVGQLLQVDIDSLKPEDFREYKLGSILNGGNGKPDHDNKAEPAAWLKLADAYWTANAERHDGRPSIPIIWGTDAVHGDGNVRGATLFPQNIGLGAARDPDLIRRIGAATAEEVKATGLDWTFAPTIAVVQDDRWGRTYESFSEEPALVAEDARAMIEGLQGEPGASGILGPAHVIATPKHFLGDGGTGGHDQGDTRIDETTLIGVHSAGYPPAIRAGALTVMSSYSSWNGAKMHGNASLLTGVLKGRFGFDGFVIGDYNGHGQLPGCAVEHCPQAIDAGLDMFMVSGDWRALYRNTLADVRAGRIPMARLDDAVRRILRVKAIAGALDEGRPSSRPLAGKFDLIGSPEHRAVARQAVRESLVLLKNEGVLPLRPSANILVAGRGADSVPMQSGGWSITWQGTGTDNSYFPHAQTIWSGIREAVTRAGGRATLSVDGALSGGRKPDAAIVVFGETPYAEFAGDRPTLEYSPEDKADLALLKRLKAAGVPVVAVFLSGRPMWVNAELNASDAFVAAFLPGTEGGGIADLLFRAPGGRVAQDFRGKLSFSWPKRPDQYRLNRRDPGYDPLFAFGYGLSYAHPGHVGRLDETRPTGLGVAAGPIYGRGKVPEGWTLVLHGQGPGHPVSANSWKIPEITMTALDRRTQEDSRLFRWLAAAEVRVNAAAPLDLSRESNGEESLVLEYRVDRAATGPVTLAMLGASGVRASVPVTAAFRLAGPEWRTLAFPLKCFERAGADMKRIASPFMLAAAPPFTVAVSDIRIASVPGAACPR